MRIAIALTALSMFALAACGAAPDAIDTKALEAEAVATAKAAVEFPVMQWEQVAEAMKSGAVLVDARGAEGFEAGHIEGAINIPCSDATAFSNLPENKDTQLVFYCGGPKCSASTKGATAAAAAGYTKIAEYKGGYPEWMKAQAPAEMPAATETPAEAAN